MSWELPVGAQVEENAVRFRVWAPAAGHVEVVIFGEDGREMAAYEMRAGEEGYFEARVEGAGAGARYRYRLDGSKLRPDPASRYQPESVHGPSQVVDSSFGWSDGEWKGLLLEELVIYELHVGTATQEGTFEALIEKLPYFRSLGVTAIELMPVADFPGERNWGYDGVDLYAPARAYGGPDGLKRLVDAAHAQGLAVIQDVVYNHLGPDGNYLRDFSPDYFTATKKTPWGDVVNFANRQVREFFICNAIYWAQEYHMDGLRMDATHVILDDSEEHVLWELPRRVRETLPEGRHFVVTAEDERNEVGLIAPRGEGGAGIDAVWADDFHHEIRSAVAGDNEGYFADYTGSAADLAETISKGWFYVGQLSAVKKRRRGTDPSGLDPAHFIYCIQNHDQVGNRPFGERLTESVGRDAYRAASALLLLSPYTPLLFQGQEWAASTPFLFFTDHEPYLGSLITKGRREEYGFFRSFGSAEIPDPQAPGTFYASKLRWDEIEQGEHRQILDLYRELLTLRHTLPALQRRTRDSFRSASLDGKAIALRYASPGGENDLLVVVNLSGDLNLDLGKSEITRAPEGYRWEAVLSTEEPRFGGVQAPGDLQQSVAHRQLYADGAVAVVLQCIKGEA